MKKIFYSLLVCAGALSFTACEDETTQDVSIVTHYITYELNEGPVVTVPMGQAFVDPGVVAMEGEEDVSGSVKVSGTVDTDNVGVYTLYYSATNKDGFASQDSRDVIVYDPNTTAKIPSGVYTTTGDAVRISAAGTVAYPGYEAVITELAPGVYSTTDFLAGWYEQRAGYGSAYAMTGYFKLNNDYTIEFIDGFLQGWGDSLDYLEEGSYDPETGEISYVAGYAGQMDFNVVMTK